MIQDAIRHRLGLETQRADFCMRIVAPVVAGLMFYGLAFHGNTSWKCDVNTAVAKVRK